MASLTFGHPLALHIAQERAESARIQMVEYRDQKVFVELERVWELFRHLPHAVDELQKHRRSIRVRVVVVAVSDALQSKEHIITNL